MDGTYFELLPEELLYKLSSCFNDDITVYQVIKLFKLDYETVFRFLLIIIHPYLSKYTLHEEFRGKRISWSTMYDYVIDCRKNQNSITSESLLELLQGYRGTSIDLYILLFKEYALMDPFKIVIKDDKLLVYEYTIRYIASSLSLIVEDLWGSLELYKDIIILVSSNFDKRVSYYTKHQDARHHMFNLKPLTEIGGETYLQMSTNYIVRLDGWRNSLHVIGIMDDSKIRTMTKFEKILAHSLGYLTH